MVATEHPQVADGERSPGELLRPQPAGSGTVEERPRLDGDLGQALAVRVADNGDDQRVVDRDRGPYVDPPMPKDLVSGPGSVDRRVHG